MPKINYLKFSQNIKSQYPEYKDWNDLELAQYFVAQEPRYSESIDFGDLKKKDQAAPSLGAQGGLQYASTGDPVADKAQAQSALKGYSQKKDKSEEMGFWENIGNNILNGSSRMWNDITQTGYEFGMVMQGVPVAGAQVLGKTARPLKEDFKTKTREEMGLLEESAAAFANSIPLMVGSIALGGVAGAGARVAGTLPMFMSGFQESGREADELGITDPLDRLTFQTIGGTIEGASELIMPDASLIRPLRQRALKDLVRVGGKGLSKADAGRYVAEFTEKVAKEVGEEYAVEIGNVLRNASFAAAGYDKAAPEMKSARDYAVMTLSAALGAGVFAGVGTGVDAAFAKSTAIKKAAENPEAAAQAAADLVDAGKLTQEQADAFLAKVASVNKAVAKMPKDVDPDVAVNTADLLNEKVDLEESVKALEEEKKNVDSSFHQGIDNQITQITARINELTQQITGFQTPTEQIAPEAPQVAPAEVSSELGMEIPQDDQSVLQVINSAIQPISSDLEARMNNAEEIPMSEIESVVDALIDAQQSVRSQEGARTRQTQGGFVTEFGALNEDQKRNFDALVEQQINKLLNYEFATITTTEQAGEKTKTAGLVATPREGRPLPESVVSRERFDGAGVRIEGKGGGRVVLKRIPGFGGRSVYGISFGNRKGVSPIEDLEFDNLEFVAPEILADGSFNAKVRDAKSGLEFTITNPELALDLAIAAQLKEAGRKEFPQPAFLEAVREVTQGQPTQVTTFPNLGRTGTTPAAVGVEPQTEQNVRQETNAPQEGRGQGEDAARVPQEEGRQEGQVTPPAVAQEGETPPATAKKPRKTAEEKADEGRATLEKLKETLRALRAKPGGGANIDLTFGVVPITKAVWNTAIDTAILAIEAGQSIAQAVKAASDYISSKIDGDWGKAKAEKYMEDQLNGVGTSTQIDDVANSAGISPKNFRDLYRVNRELFGLNQAQAMADAIAMDRMISVMAKRAGITKEEMYGRLKFEKASEDFVKGLSNKAKLLFQLVGENAELAQDIRDNLQVARNMETAGKDAKTIRMATGWEKGKDGKWRYEIEDVELSKDVKKYFEKGLNPQAGAYLRFVINDVGGLFEKYPQLNKTRFEFYDGERRDAKGSYNSRKNTISVNRLMSEGEIRSIIAHEIQHAIQDIEGFAIGGDPRQMRTPNDVLENLANQLSSEPLTREDRVLIKSEYEKNGLKRLPILPTYLDVTSDDPDIIEDFIDKLSIIVDLFPNKAPYKNLRDALDLRLMEIGGENVAFEKYKRLAGEVEAKNVQSRMGMTPEQRRATTLQETEDVARDEQIVLFENNGLKMQVDAWQGSPYQFDEFKSEKIGTGEGVQAFGWGLYFTDLKKIATYYAKKLAKKPEFKYLINDKAPEGYIKQILDYFERTGFDGPVKTNLINYIKDDIQEYKASNDTKSLKEAEDALRFIRGATVTTTRPERYVYKTSIFKGKTPDQYTWLEWYKPISQEVKRKLLDFIKNDEKYGAGIEEGRINTWRDVKRSIKYRLENNLYSDGRALYLDIAEEGGLSPKSASLFLLDAGIDGNKYPIGSLGRQASAAGVGLAKPRGFNYVVFDENAISIEKVIKFQEDAIKARGAVMVSMDGRATIYALSDPNVSTPLHELAHVFEHYLTDEERSTVQQWAKTKDWNIKTSESFARGFEKYLSEGQAPTPALQKIFDNFKQWLTDIYRGIVGSDIDIELNKPMRDLYAKMFDQAAPTQQQAQPEASERGKAKSAEEIFNSSEIFEGQTPNQAKLFFADALNDFKVPYMFGQPALDPRSDMTLTLNGAKFLLSENQRGPSNYVLIDDFLVNEDLLGTGKGRDALVKLIEYADKNGITLVGEPLAMEGRRKSSRKGVGLSQKDLTDFYKRYGFTKISKESLSNVSAAETGFFERKPQQQAQPEAQVSVDGTAKERRDKFFDEIEGMYRAFPFQPGFIISEKPNKDTPLKDAKILGRLSVYEGSNDGSLYIDEVQAQNFGERTGNGSKIMQIVSDMADKYGLTIELVASPISGNNMTGAGRAIAKALNTPEKLAKFYEKFGFVNVADNLGREEYSRITKELRSAGFSTVNPVIPPSRQLLMVRPPKVQQQAQPKAQVEATAKALNGVDVSSLSNVVSIPQTLETKELDQIPRGETFQEKYAPEYFEKLKKDIKENGIKEPVTLKYYVKDNAIRLIEGHHRLKIAKELGIKNVPVKVDVVWGTSIVERNEDIKGKPILNPPTSINEEKYSKRNYAPSNIAIEELGYKNKFIAEAYHKAKADGSNPELVQAVEDLLGKTTPEAKPAKTIAEQRKEFRETAKKYFEGMKKMGVIFDAERNATEDIAFIKALTKYIKLEIDNGMVTFKGFVEKTAGMIEDFNDASVKRIARDVWSKEVVKAYPKIYAKLQKAQKALLDKELVEARKELRINLKNLLSDKKIFKQISSLTTERKLDKSSSDILVGIRSEIEALGGIGKLSDEQLISYSELATETYKEGRINQKQFIDALAKEKAETSKNAKSAITNQGERSAFKLKDAEEAREFLAENNGDNSNQVNINNGEVIVESVDDFDAILPLIGKGATFGGTTTSPNPNNVKRGKKNFFRTTLGGGLIYLLDKFKGKKASQETIDFFNNLQEEVKAGTRQKKRLKATLNNQRKVAIERIFRGQARYIAFMLSRPKVNGKRLVIKDNNGKEIKRINVAGVLYYYQLMKDPHFLKKDGNGERKIGLSESSMKDIVDFINLPENAKVRELINIDQLLIKKAAQNAAQVMEANNISSELFTPRTLDLSKYENDTFVGEILNKIYNNAVPSEIEYFPSNVESDANSQVPEVDALLDQEMDTNAVSAMSRFMIERVSGGKVRIKSYDAQLGEYFDSMSNTASKLPILKRFQAVFNKENSNLISSYYGKNTTDELRENIGRYITSRQQDSGLAKYISSGPFSKWLASGLGVQMVFAFTSAFSQLSSTPGPILSYGVKNYLDGLLMLTSGEVNARRAIVDLTDGSLFRERFGSRIEVADIVKAIPSDETGFASYVNEINKKLISIGAIPSSAFDALSIILSLPIYAREYSNALKTMTRKEAADYAENVLMDKAENFLQSKSDEMMSSFESKHRTTLYAFATVVPQLQRQAIMAFKRIQRGEGDLAQNINVLVWSGIGSSVAFRLLRPYFESLFEGDDDDEELKKLRDDKRLKRTTIDLAVDATKSLGTWGAISAGVLKTAYQLAEAEGDASVARRALDITPEVLEFVPAASIKVSSINNAIKSYYDDEDLRGTTQAIQALTNIPAEKARGLAVQMSDAFLIDQFTLGERLTRLAGFVSENKAKEKIYQKSISTNPEMRELLSPSEIQRFESKQKSEYKSATSVIAKQYSEATTQQDRDVAMSKLFSLQASTTKYSAKESGELIQQIQDDFDNKVVENSLPEGFLEIKRMPSTKKVNFVANEFNKIKDTDEALSYVESLYMYGVISENERGEVFDILLQTKTKQ